MDRCIIGGLLLSYAPVELRILTKVSTSASTPLRAAAARLEKRMTFSSSSNGRIASYAVFAA